MKILLAAKHAPHGSRPIGGVQSWCRTVADELDRRGHEAYTWGPEQTLPTERFDLGIIANAEDTASAFDLCDKTINVCHGIIPAEKPAQRGLTAFTSEEIRDYWKVDGAIVRQPIDMTFWTPGKAERMYLTRFSYRRGLQFIEPLAKALNLTYHHLRDASAWGAWAVIHKSACVLATGRAALEAMSCGVPVVICDHRAAYQGPLMDLDIEGAMTRNYSGRGGVRPNIENVHQAIEESMARGSMRSHVQKHHDVKDITDQLLALA